MSTATTGRFDHLPHHTQEGHFVQLYKDDGFLLEVLSRFVGGALTAGDGAVVIATKEHRAALDAKLSWRGLDTTKAEIQGRYISLDASETLSKITVNGSIDVEQFNDVIGGVLAQIRNTIGENRHLAAFGEMVSLLWVDGKVQQALRLEEFWNLLAKKYSFSLICAYPMAELGHQRHTTPFLKMCNAHILVGPTESYLDLTSEADRMRDVAHLEQHAEALRRELELRETEARFRLLVEAAQDYAIFMLDPAGNISSWNIGAERIKGYKADEIIGRHFSCFYPEEDLLNGKPQWELVIASKEGRFEDEGWRIRKDGSKFWANVIISAMRDESGNLIGFAKVTRDFTDRMKVQRALEEEVAQRRTAQQQLLDSARSLRMLSLHLLRTQDEERRRIGRDLHDSLGQYLAVLKMKLATVAQSIEPKEEPISKDVDQCISLTDEAIKEVRTVSYLLYPPMLDEMGLKSAIPWYLDGFTARSGIKTTFQAEEVSRLHRDCELALFRVLQESLTNVHRHSGSKTAQIRLFVAQGSCVLEVEDKGKGFSLEFQDQIEKNVTAFGVGVRGMNERMRQLGGRLELSSTVTGTIVRAIVPIGDPSTS
jgi:PAS domain S-box-containing protein